MLLTILLMVILLVCGGAWFRYGPVVSWWNPVAGLLMLLMLVVIMSRFGVR